MNKHFEPARLVPVLPQIGEHMGIVTGNKVTFGNFTLELVSLYVKGINCPCVVHVSNCPSGVLAYDVDLSPQSRKR